jgi:hypothetical protein
VRLTAKSGGDQTGVANFRLAGQSVEEDCTMLVDLTKKTSPSAQIRRFRQRAWLKPGEEV